MANERKRSALEDEESLSLDSFPKRTENRDFPPVISEVEWDDPLGKNRNEWSGIVSVPVLSPSLLFGLTLKPFGAIIKSKNLHSSNPGNVS